MSVPPPYDHRDAHRRWTPLREEAALLAAAFPPLAARPRRTGPSLQGPHGRRRPGPGDAFWQFRRSRPGDPSSSIDWRRSARSDHLFVREREWEASQTVWIWRDASASMQWRSDEAVPTKSWRASVLAVALATLLVEGGERIGAPTSAAEPGGGRPALRRFAFAASDDADYGANLPQPDDLGRDAVVVMIGDFLDAPDVAAAFVRTCADRGLPGCACQVLDPAELDFPFRGRTRFEDVESRDDLLAGRAESLAMEYKHAMDALRAELSDIFAQAGWPITLHRTDAPPRKALLALHRALADSGGLRR